MRSIRNTAFTLAATIGLICASLMFGPLMQRSPTVQAQGNQGIVSINPNARLPVMTFTATSQTVARPIGGFSSATVEIFGVATAATMTMKCSNDGGANYYAIPWTAGAYTTNVLQVTTPGAFTAYAGTPELFYVDLAGFTNCEVVTSGTFTGASASVQIVASSNRGIF